VRIRIIFSLKNRGAVIPFHHQYILSDLVTDVLAKCNKEYTGYDFYNFSGLKGQTKVARTGLCFYSSKVTLVFASPNEDLIRDFILCLFEREEIELGQLKLIPESVVKEEDVTLEGNQNKFVCISPIVLMAPSLNANTKKFISPETDAFSDLLYESTMNRMERSGKFTAEQITSFYKFQVVPDKDYLHKIKSEEKKFARIYPTFDSNNKYEIRGYTMPFTLFAEPEVQQFVFDYGLGEVGSKGFGMLDIANTEPFKRVVNIELDKKNTSTVSH
jgi:CRISPR-associated endoribonuclease Cas6